eukprot:EG_transcript_36715
MQLHPSFAVTSSPSSGPACRHSSASVISVPSQRPPASIVDPFASSAALRPSPGPSPLGQSPYPPAAPCPDLRPDCRSQLAGVWAAAHPLRAPSLTTSPPCARLKSSRPVSSPSLTSLPIQIPVPPGHPFGV